jgi:hypothetical protein
MVSDSTRCGLLSQSGDIFFELKLEPKQIRFADSACQAELSSLLRKNGAMDRCAQDSTNDRRQPK